MNNIRDFMDNLTLGDNWTDELPHDIDIEVGSEVKLGNETFIVLERMDYIGAAKVIRKNLLGIRRAFGNNADWRDSPIRRELNDEYYNSIVAAIGEHNIFEMSRDLTSLDGLDDFGRCDDKISLLTRYEYAKYHKILGLQPSYASWWWLITPFSTPSGGYARSVCCVRGDGGLNWFGCDIRSGVRPFLTVAYEALQS